MNDRKEKLEKPRNGWSPLGVLIIFIGLIDSVLFYSITQVTGTIQTGLFWFASVFTFLFFWTFIFILWKRPHILYSPSEWGETPKIQDFMQAMSGSFPKQSDVQERKIIEASELVNENSVKQIEENNLPYYLDLLTNEKYAEVRETIKLALSDQNNKIQASFLKTISAIALSYINLYESISELKAVIEEYPNDIQPYRALARTYERSSEFTKAIDVLNRGINHVAKDDKTSLKLEKLDIYSNWGEIKYIEEITNIALEIENVSKEPSQIAKAYRILGFYFQKNKMFEKAKIAFIRAYHSARVDRENLEKIANFFRDVIADSKTELYFRTLLANQSPNNESALVLLGNCYLLLQQYDLVHC